jgi:hypothetical protein
VADLLVEALVGELVVVLAGTLVVEPAAKLGKLVVKTLVPVAPNPEAAGTPWGETNTQLPERRFYTTILMPTLRLG